MKLTIVFDNTAFRKDLQPDWGFAALVETETKKILFDTGANGAILLSNMQKLGINPKQISEVFISHHHFDHTGGLSAFLNANNDVKLWSPPSFRGVKNVRELVYVEKPTKLDDGLYSTGELEGIEQSLCVETKRGIAIIVGCSHPNMEDIISTASQFGKVYAVIGGMHGNKPESLKNVDLICATHCTQHQEEIKSLYPEKCVEGGAGKIIEI